MPLRSAAAGVMPGTDLLHSAELQAAELPAPHLPGLPELPGRGLHSQLLGRSLAQLSELATELTSYGWRLTQRPGADDQRARGWLRSDVDTLADVRGRRREAGLDATDENGLAAPLVLELLGPISLMASLALPSGEKVLTDHGARRDLAGSLAAGVAEHLTHVRRACAPSSLTVIIAEPDYIRARGGLIPTVSGYRTIRALDREEARGHLGIMIETLQRGGAEEILLDLGGGVEAEHLQDFRATQGPRVSGFGVDLTVMQAQGWERTAELVESGATMLASTVTAAEAAAAARPHSPEAARRGDAQLPQVNDLARRLRGPWDRIGMPLSSLESFILVGSAARHQAEPARSQFASLTEPAAMRVLTRVRDTAEALRDQLREA
ncbi:hypothetical protein BG28_06425 [Nesterenkonia sp. AN1]|uniref:Uncharacterized protein n=1 Tax=Nesterenkonia aurantiaca TaxID=1436010 RepID=A0A4R7G6V7_9MICC|nr:hypothetical protein [Nesterenkonia]EXF25993.1 hypothetical protein BG28_06425 [Nesterenkonia sp. AN1]TDS87254.1 hypothetical protein EV640_10135 [Nesterenkonia aurantiaca]